LLIARGIRLAVRKGYVRIAHRSMQSLPICGCEM
jgi:hypothetical protein